MNNNLVVIKLADPVGKDDAERLAEALIKLYPDFESVTPAHGDGFGRTVYDMERMKR